MMVLPLDSVLAFVDECELSDDAYQHSQDTSRRPHRSSCESTASSGSETAAPKTRPRRDVVEIKRLQEVEAALEQQLKLAKGFRSVHRPAQQQPSPWKSAAELQSNRRAAAQRENERLRDRLQTQRKVAKRLVRLIKRSSTLQVRKEFAIDSVRRCNWFEILSVAGDADGSAV